MDRVLAQVETAETNSVLRGLEGHASARYFRALRALLNPEYGFRTRNRIPPRDPANALLSFAYSLLTAEATAAVAAARLEPALDLYHRPRGGRPALALDLVEEFRAPAAEALVLQLTGWRAISPEDFLPRGGGVRMRARARRRFLEGYEQKMAKAFTSRHGTPTTLREAVRAQAAELTGASGRAGRMCPSSIRSTASRRMLVVTYDVVDDWRRERVARTLLDFGVRVQYSVFECALTRAQRRELVTLLRERIAPVEDTISFYVLCRPCEGRVLRIGRAPPEPEPQYVIV